MVAVVFFILLRTSADGLFPRWFRHWDLLLPFIIYFGQRRSLTEGLILSLFVSHLYSLGSSAPIGVFATHYLCIFVLVRMLSYGIYADTWLSVFLMLLGLSVVSRIVLPLVAKSFGQGWPILTWSNLSIVGFLVNSCLGLLAYMSLVLLDKISFKAPQTSIELSESRL